MRMGKKKWNWTVDVVLMAGFLTTFFINLTGLSWHQWLGVGAGALAAYHMQLHWGWCKAIVKKPFHRLSLRLRSYFFLDAGLLIGFLMILGTGLVISTWLQTSPPDSFVWRDLHIASSYITALLVTVKVAMKIGFECRCLGEPVRHLFRLPAERYVSSSPGLPAPVLAVHSAWHRAVVGRRQFLSMVGMAGLAAYFTADQLLFEKKPLVAAPPSKQQPLKTSAETPRRTIPRSTTANPAVSPPVTASPMQESVGMVSDRMPSQNVGAPATAKTSIYPADIAASAPAERSCSILCSRQCLSPGKCGRYTDRDGNGRCDLGECQ